MKKKVKNVVNKIKNFENKKVLLLISLLLVVVIIGIILIVFVFSSDKNASIDKNTATYENEKEEVIKEQEVEGLLMEEVKVTYSEQTSSFNVQVTNTTESEYYLSKVNVNCLDKDGNVLITLVGNFNQELAVDETVSLEVGTTFNLGDVEKLEYEIIKDDGE